MAMSCKAMYLQIVFQNATPYCCILQSDTFLSEQKSKGYNVLETFSKKKAILLHTTKLVLEIQNVIKHGFIVTHN